MLKTAEQQDYENVYGITYDNAKAQMEAMEQAIQAKAGQGFASDVQCAQFAHDIHADIAIYQRSTGLYRFTNHTGDMLVKSSWQEYYRSILYWTYENDKGVVVPDYYTPSDYKMLRNARIPSEVGDGKHEPLFNRNYFVPTGYYDETTGTFNDAIPFEVFAAETGADTSFIYTLLQNTAGECYPHVLAWLRQKMLHPTQKLEVIPIFVGVQGGGKSTLGEAICTAMFGVTNVIVTYQFDVQARFNADTVNKLIISIEEKGEKDNKNTAAAIKSAATAKRVRREHKGIDPYDQESYTDFIMSTNEMVPMKFEDRDRQRRFMVMEVNPNFTRERSALADEIFTRIYGEDALHNRICKSLMEDAKTVAQFKHELYTEKDCKGVNYKDFPLTAAYHRCFTIPRTNDAVHIESIARGLIPFIRASLLSCSVVKQIELFDEVTQDNITVTLDSVIPDITAMQYVAAHKEISHRVVFCEPITFMGSDGKPYAHSTVQKILLDMRQEFEQEGILLLDMTRAPSGGFKSTLPHYRYCPAVWFALAKLVPASVGPTVTPIEQPMASEVIRIGKRVRYNKFKQDDNGVYETLNEMIPGTEQVRKASNAQYTDTFLLEADDAPLSIREVERQMLEALPEGGVIDAEKLYAQRLDIQEKEAERLFKFNIVARVVYSGGKSLHMLVRVKYAPTTKKEREWLHAYLTSTLSNKLLFDQATKDPLRLTRAPVTLERRELVEGRWVVGKQRLLKEDWSHIWTVDWRIIYEAWKNAPPSSYEQRGKMLPSKEIYKEAAKALLEGTFFTSIQFKGIRQDTFFPAYRLIRSMGYTHDEVWLDFNEQIEQYPKANERTYWRTRADCDLIRSIDAEFDG